MVNDFHFWFSTKYLDPETGLYYYGHRLYSPTLERWLNRDPIGEWAFVMLDLSFYSEATLSSQDSIMLNSVEKLLGEMDIQTLLNIEVAMQKDNLSIKGLWKLEVYMLFSRSSKQEYSFVNNSSEDYIDYIGLAKIIVDSKCTACDLKGYRYKPEHSTTLSPLKGTVSDIDGIYLPTWGGTPNILKVPGSGTINVECPSPGVVVVWGWWPAAFPTWIYGWLREKASGTPGWQPGWYPDGKVDHPVAWPPNI